MEWSKAKYVILGDDVLIGDHDLAIAYRTMLKRLGVEVSELKTHQSDKLYEFAKRLVYNGVEITPFPVSSLTESSRRFYLLVDLLRQEQRKGWSWSIGIPASVSAFYQIVLGFSAKFCTEIQGRSFLTEIITNVIRGSLPAHDGLNTIIRQYGLPLPTLTPEQGIAILSGTALEVFVENNPLDYDKGESLGGLALYLTIELTGLENVPTEITADLPSSVPLLSVFGQISEKYIDLSRQAYLIDTIGKGEWPMHLRTLALPVSDKVFVERASHTIIRVGSVLGDRVFKNLKGLRKEDF